MTAHHSGVRRPRWGRPWCLTVLAVALSAVVVTAGASSDVARGQRVETRYVGLEPFRLVDTRHGIGVQRIDDDTWRVTAAGVGGVPVDASAISVSMVATGATGSGYLLTYPAGSPLPVASNLNYEPGRTYSSGAIIPLNNGQFDVFVDSPTHFIVDVTGAFVPSGATRAGRFVPLDSPARAFDSRSGRPVPGGGVAVVTLPPFVPPDATAALVTITSSAPNNPGFFTVFTGNSVPTTSALNVATANSDRATTAIWPVADRSFKVFSSAGGHLIVDVVGYFTGGSAATSSEGLFVPMDPVRRLDTRQSGAIGSNEARSFPAPGGGVAVGSITMVEPRRGGYGTLWANGTPMPPTSSINLTDGYVIANLGVTRVTDAGAAIFSSAPSHYLFDQFGYFTNASATASVPTVPDRPPAGAPSGQGCSVSVLLVPSCGIWFGASTASRDGSFDYRVGLDEYEAVARNTPDILHFYKTGPVRFPTSSEVSAAQRPGLQRSLLLYNWKPSSRFTWRQVANGAADAEIATIAASMKAYRYKLFLNIYHEPEDNVIPTAGSGMTAADYAAMYRRVVTKLREAGVTNAVYVWNTMGFYGWRQYLDDLYPGNEYVDWLAYDPYITNDTAVDLHGMINFTFRGMPDWPGYYAWVTAKAPGKPVMLAEWGVDLRTNADPSSKLNVDVNEIVRRYPMLKAMVYWNDRNDHHVDVRIDDPSAKGVAYGAAYRRLAAHPVFNAMTPDSAP